MDDEDLKAELTCPICMDLFREPRRLPCGHVYCRVCLQDMLTRKYLNTRASERILSCPECRQRYDLTFQEAGVDVFTRDFKLFRLVELFEKKFSRGREDAGGDEGAQAGAGDQTAVKTVYSSERESSPQSSSSTQTSASSSVSQSATDRLSSSSSARQQAEAGHPSFASSGASVSDDSWIYVSPDSPHVPTRPVLPSGRHERADDSWLLPSVQSEVGAFPVDREQDVRGSAGATEVRYHTLSADSVNISGRYDNSGPETFQRFAAEEPTVHLVRLPPSNPPVASRSSESSSESDTSDERGEDVSDDRSGEEGSGSGSEADSQGRNRRSRLSRFFRSLVMSDSDSYDDDEQAYQEDRGAHFQRAEGAHYRREPYFHREGVQQGSQPHSYNRQGGDYFHSTSSSMAACNPRIHDRGGDPLSGPAAQSAYAENGEAHDDQSLTEDHQRSPAVSGSRPEVEREREKTSRCDSNHNALADPRGAHADVAMDAAEVAAPAVSGGAVGGVGRAMAPSGRGRSAVHISDDSDDDYEPQTSMLRPKRKPRSRLKKFFTSLLSLSSSDEDEEEGEGQRESPPSTSERP